ncbi:hypothetical protein FSP39_025007 [Pinctada imbricata]|uniref:Galactosyltransferase N-terminal domain-containing protein n=1 Tax=Pinctada imbricata TaxID=66713 RepID=A0AA89BN14_PINIB|nr:hypothetical protein FSP39_025007 [Pinctada imbricata]
MIICRLNDSLNHELSHIDMLTILYLTVGRITPQLATPLCGELDSKFWMLKPGGLYSPNHCVARHKVAIIIAYRNREEHLRILLNNLHPFLQKQQLEYGIFVVEQEEGCRFNRAMLMNIGFKEVSSMYDYKCFIFHDVDHLPENDFNMYSCTGNPRHMAVAVDKFGYK